MNTRSLTIFLILISLTLSTFLIPPVSPSQAAGTTQTKTTSLQIWNRSDGQIVFQLSGPKNYSFTVMPNEKLNVQVLKGNYKYSYDACGANQNDKITINKPTKFATTKCSLVIVTFNNKTPRPLIAKFSGPAEYKFTFPLGVTKFKVIKGAYDYTLQSYACNSGGKSLIKTGKIKFINGTRWGWSGPCIGWR